MKTWLVVLFLLSSAWGWQQDVRYTIQATLDTHHHTLAGNEQIVYTNRSPDTLDFVWLHLYPNAYRDRNTVFGRELERMQSYNFSFARPAERGFIDIQKLQVDGADAKYQIAETEMKVNLPRPLCPGDSTALALQFFVKIPNFFSRLGHKGNHYEITQWYPKMVVYDRGVRQSTNSLQPDSLPAPNAKGPLGQWHPDGFHAIGEFYGEFGTFDVALTVPANMMVGATGTLVEPAAEIAWMHKTLAERKKVKSDAPKTLRFHAENVHDFAWVADPDYVLMTDTQNGITINVLARSKSEKDWRQVTGFAKDALNYFTRWYGPYPYRQVTVAQGSFPAGGGMEYPNLVIISATTPSWIRGLETTVIHEICHQWFYGILGSNEMAEAWLDEGITTFTEIRYLEAKYGPDNYFNWPGFLGALPNTGDRYFHSLIYHITATNHLEYPILTPAYTFVDNPIAYQGDEYSKAGLVMNMLRAQVGDSVFDVIMHRYYEEFKFRHPHTEDFIATAQTVSGFELGPFFDQWLRTTKTCDFKIKSVSSAGQQTRVTIARTGAIVMPVRVMVVAKNGVRQLRTWDGKDKEGVLVFETPSPVRQIIVDPYSELVEIDRWNNYYPKKVEIKPVFDFPSFDAYQIFYCPYIWFNGGDGLELGVWLQGRQFIDYDFLKGANEWGAGIVYSFRSQSWKPSFNYQTPLPLFDRRLRLRLGGSISRLETNFNFGFNGKFGPVLRLPSYEATCEYQFNQLKDLAGKDPRDWELAKTGRVKLDLSHSYLSRCWRGQEKLDVGFSPPVGGGDFRYLKVSGEVSQTLRLGVQTRITARFFGGNIWGTAPAQNQFYLSGSLLPTGIEPLTLAFQQTWATQEHWHINGDANLRGYAGEHQRGTTGAAFNLTLSGLGLPLTPFFDLGAIGNGSINFEHLKSDAGVSVNVGPLYADFPLWVSSPRTGESNFKFRWLVGVSLALGLSVF